MKDIKIKPKKSLLKSIYDKSRRIISESKFWNEIALQQQLILHAKNKT